MAERHGWFVTSFTLALSDLHWGLVPGVEYVNRFQVEAARAEGSFEGAWGYRLGA